MDTLTTGGFLLCVFAFVIIGALVIVALGSLLGEVAGSVLHVLETEGWRRVRRQAKEV